MGAAPSYMFTDPVRYTHEKLDDMLRECVDEQGRYDGSATLTAAHVTVEELDNGRWIYMCRQRRSALSFDTRDAALVAGLTMIAHVHALLIDRLVRRRIDPRMDS